jgi:hypothetical protein
MPRIRFRSSLTPLLLFASALLPPSALAGTVTGSANVVLGDDIMRSVSFSAGDHRDGAVSGHIEFEDPAPVPDQDVDGTGDPALAGSKSGVHVLAEVNCMVIVKDGIAIVGGIVRKAEPARYVDKQMLLFVEDSGRARGRFAWGFYEASERPFCDSYTPEAYVPVSVIGGDFRVQP